MAIPAQSSSRIEQDAVQEPRNANCFGLIAEADFPFVFLHGYDITLDGAVVVPQLQPAPSRSRRDSGELRVDECLMR
jgi:hypothetical protein